MKSYMQLGHGNDDCGSCLSHFPARYVHALCAVPAPSMQIWLRGRPTSLLFRLVPLTIAFNSRFNHVWSLDRHPWAPARWWRRRTDSIVCPEVFKSSALRMGIIRESFRGRVMTSSTIVIGREMLEQRPWRCFETRKRSLDMPVVQEDHIPHIQYTNVSKRSHGRDRSVQPFCTRYDTRAAPAPGNPICGGISRLGVSLSLPLLPVDVRITGWSPRGKLSAVA
jgi:hypothetical protein